MPICIWAFVPPLQTGTTGALVKSGELVPVHHMADSSAGLPWFLTTSPSFSTSQPAFQRFSLTTTCPASKRNSLLSLMGGSGTCKLPEVSRFPPKVSFQVSLSKSLSFLRLFRARLRATQATYVELRCASLLSGGPTLSQTMMKDLCFSSQACMPREIIVM